MKHENLSFSFDRKKRELTFLDADGQERLLIIPDAMLFTPQIDGKDTEWLDIKCRVQDNGLLIRANATNHIGSFEVRLQRVSSHVEISSSFLAVSDCELNRIDLFPAGTGLNLYDVVNFRNRHFVPNTWPELLLGGKGFETDTYSADWQFAPHPTMMILRKNRANLFFGALDLPRAFGMYLKADNHRVRHWYLDYGASGSGLRLKAGETFQSPRFALLLDHGRSVHQTCQRYTKLLIRNGLIPDPQKKKRVEWHTKPLYCTWGDQGARSDARIAAELNEQAAGAAPALKAMNEKLVRDAMATIRKKKLPFKTIILDAGWSVMRGQWEPHPQRFPDFHKLVDDIHAMGIKVVVWWAWPEIDDKAQVSSDYLMGNGKRNRHGCRMFDFSNPRTQQEYLAPLFRKLFSNEDGCYDLDGIKTDFIADKIHADMPVFDPSWRGEENYFLHLYALCQKLMRTYKPDGCHHAYAGNPFLMEYIDVNRTADVHTSNVEEHVERAKMLHATAPGCPVAFDFHNYLEKLNEYFAAARGNAQQIQISNILYVKKDIFSKWQNADDKYYRFLRDGLSRFERGKCKGSCFRYSDPDSQKGKSRG